MVRHGAARYKAVRGKLFALQYIALSWCKYRSGKKIPPRIDAKKHSCNKKYTLARPLQCTNQLQTKCPVADFLC